MHHYERYQEGIQVIQAFDMRYVYGLILCASSKTHHNP